MTTQVLGVDLGVASVGWALLEYSGDKPRRIVASGVRIFEAGADGDIESGRDMPRNAKRRQARQHRRQLARRAQRMSKLAHLLQTHGLLPEGPVEPHWARHALLLEIDRRLRATAEAQDSADTPLYRLRARALKERLEPWELGRALYHLAQRRGYQSNRKVRLKDEDEEGKVQRGIALLKHRMAESESRTLGEYFAQLDPREERIRGRWTSRAMYVAEFEAIWAAQAAHYPELLTSRLRDLLYQAIFYQRPLQSSKNLVGRCPYEPTRKRAPVAILEFQRFRVLQQVNHTRIIGPSGEILPLTSEQRGQLIKALEFEGDLTFKKALRCLDLPAGHTFTIESAEAPGFIGNRSSAKLRGIFGARWSLLSPEQQSAVLEDVLSVEDDTALAKRGRCAWGLDDSSAAAFAALRLEPGYGGLSRQALMKLMPAMEQGQPYMTAVKEVYGVRKESAVHDSLPPVDQALPSLRNPVVHRCLTELRKVVNAIVREYGKPEVIRVELARDVKNTAKERKRIAKHNLENRSARARAAERILRETGDTRPSRADVEKVLLAEECHWECPYTGKPISIHSLFGESPQFDVEHIIPFSRCLDNSFANKTLCYHEENRSIKRGRTPYQAYGSVPATWEAILERVKRFERRGVRANPKLQRFQLQSMDSLADFAEQQLNDTRYASREATHYLGLLYGGAVDAAGRRRVQASRGRVTADLRNAWRLNEILRDGTGNAGTPKNRGDHRHHAVDAIAIALTDTATVQRVSRAAEKAEKHRQWKWWRDLEAPWDGFVEDARQVINGLHVSHRPSRKVSGPIHDETLYSPPYEAQDRKTYVHVRKPLDALSTTEVEEIADPIVRAVVHTALDGQDPKRFFGSVENHPVLVARDGRKIPIHRVRLRKCLGTIAIGGEGRRRYVKPGANHHAELLATVGRGGELKWVARMVSLADAQERLRQKQPIVRRETGPAERFVCSLAPGDLFLLDDQPAPFLVRSVSQERTGGIRIEYTESRDARKKADIKAAKAWGIIVPNQLLKRHCQKVAVDPLGRLTPAND